MIEARGLKLYVSRGDTGSVTITFEGEDTPDDTVIALMVLQRTRDSDSIWEKRIPVSEGKVVIPFRSIDTKDLLYGEYAWILRLLYENGDVYTPMEDFAKFIVLPAGGDIDGGDEGE